MTAKTAVVTGASGGIGSAVVAELVRLGMSVHALALPDEHLDSLKSLDGVTTHGIDVRDTAALTGILAGIDADLLVNNAGTIGELTTFQNYSATTADALIDINFRSAVQATLAVLPGMVARNRGHILFTGSIAATRPTANTAVYSATKAALHAFADGLRMDLFGTSVRVTVLAPGRVQTRLYDETLGGHDAAVSRLYSGAASIQPAEIAQLVGIAVSLPAHIDVTRLEVVPTAQVYGGSQI
jgi:3-hydroxy acid dehydrogenase / malonic semialdehyde reductase